MRIIIDTRPTRDKVLPMTLKEALHSTIKNKVLYESKQFVLYRDNNKYLWVYYKMNDEHFRPFYDKECKLYKLPRLLKEQIFKDKVTAIRLGNTSEYVRLYDSLRHGDK